MKLRNPGLLLILIVLATLVPRALPDLVRNSTVALQLRPMDDAARRNIVIGLYYKPLHAIRDRIPEHESVAIVMADDPLDRDIGVFVNYYLYPQPALFYRGIDAYRENRFEGAVRKRDRPDPVIWIDHGQTPEPRLLRGYQLLATPETTAP